MLHQPAFDFAHDGHLVLRLPPRQLQQVGERYEVCHQHLAAGGAHPENRAVCLLIAISIFYCQLRLANTSQSSKRSYLGGSSREQLMQLAQEIPSASEIGIAKKWYIPGALRFRLLLTSRPTTPASCNRYGSFRNIRKSATTQ